MNTKTIMIASSVFLLTSGIAYTFLPDELLNSLNVEDTSLLKLILQLTGALYLGFAVLNWMQRKQIIGGIYGRPLLLANMIHFISGAFAFIKIFTILSPSAVIMLYGLLYLAFASFFSILLFKNPAVESKQI